MQATRGIHDLWLLPLMFVLAVAMAGCSGTAEDTAATPSPTSSSTTTVAAPRTSTTPPTTTATTSTTTTTTTTTASPAPSTTAPETIPERSMVIPAAAAPSIDGVIDPGEWESAAVVTLSNGDTAYWQHDAATLYVALDGDDLGAVNLILATDGELWILHSSAALGSSLYMEGEETWEQVHGYTWCCRSAHDDTARLGLLRDEGWQANIGFTGDIGVVEYQVAIPWGFARAALVYHAEERDSTYWPDDLDPDNAEHIIMNMWTDPELDPGSWLMLVPGE